VAVNCWVAATTTLAEAGAIVIEDNVTWEGTVMVAVAVFPPKVAVIVAVPAATTVARPWALIDATDALDELQATWVVKSRVVPSEYVPEAENCCVVPAALLAVAGVTVRVDKVAGLTVRVVESEILPKVAVMVVVPAATAVANPVLLIDATDVLDEDQVTCVLMSRLVPSEYVPVATNCLVLPVPTGTLALSGVTAKEDKVAEVTVRVAVPDLPPEAAVMVVWPPLTPVARPLALTVATPALSEVQVACAVISWLVPSEYTPMAENC
jgi:hypothetical protein